MNDQTFVLLDQLKGRITQVIQASKTEKTTDTDVKIDVFVNQKLPEVISLAQTVLADGRLDFFELVRIVTFLSSTVRDSLDIYSKSNQGEKLGIVREIIKFLVKELTGKELPDNKYIDGLIEFVYQLIVKRR